MYGTPLAFLVLLATSLTGIGMLFGVAAHTAMSQCALLVKKRAARLRRRWRGAQKPVRPRNVRRGSKARSG